MRTVRLVIAFQGTHYLGWQIQKSGPSTSSGRCNTIQEVFERALAKLFKEKVPLTGSSRTDSGVHARGYVASFRTQSTIADAGIKAALNHYLPKDILTLSAKTVRPDFHARFDAKSKTYQYDIWMSRTRPLFEAPLVLWYPKKLDVRLMKKCAQHLIGRHDFGAFKDKGSQTKSDIRTIKRLTLKKNREKISIIIEADGFLMHMVRVIVGTLIQAGSMKIAPEKTKELLRSKRRSQAGPTAHAQGLTLIKVKY